MLDTGGGGGGTPWESMTLDKMQELIQNPNPDAHWKLAGAWQRSAELLDEHRFQMLQYRDSLAAVWPPEKSAASAAYLERLDQLISSLTETYEASVRNHKAFAAVTGSIYQAQVQMDKIYQEYLSNKATTTAPERQEQLRLQAVKLLSGVSNDLAEAQLSIVTPPTYQPGRTSEDDPHSIGSATHVPPPIPPITPARRSSTETPSRLVASVPAAVVSGTQLPGLVLGGVDPLPSTASPTTGVGVLPSALPSGAASLDGPGLLPPAAGFRPGDGRPPAPPATSPGIGRGTGLPQDGVLRPGDPSRDSVRAVAPGGIIGGVPAGGSGQARRTNPIGRLTGFRGGSAGGLSTPEHPSGPYGQAVAGRPGSRSRGRDKPWDPDNPWETEEGVAPVLRPAREQRIDPGPVIGLP